MGIINKQGKKRKPKAIEFVCFIVIVLLWARLMVPIFANVADVGLFFSIILAPLIIVGLFLSYNSGVVLAECHYDLVAKGLVFLPLIITHIICIVIGILRDVMMSGGYPLRACYASCIPIEMSEVVMTYFITTTFFFLPAYYATYRYRKWVLKYKLPKPLDD